MSDELYYAQVLKPQGSSRFSIELLNGNIVESTLKGEMRRKSRKKSNELNPYDWVKVQKTDITISGCNYKILEKIGNDKDKNVKDLKKSGFLNKTIKEDTKPKDILDNRIIIEGQDEEQDDEDVDADDFIDNI